MSAALLGLAHTPWWLATITETYTLSLALFSVELLCLISLLRRPGGAKLALLTGVCGLGLCVHNLALLALPVYAIVAITLASRKKISLWWLPAASITFIMGAGIYISMILTVAFDKGGYFAITSALFGNYTKQVLNINSTSGQFSANAVLMGMNCAGLMVPLALVGWVRFRRFLGGAMAAALGGITLIHAVFVLRYSIPDQFTFLLPTLMMAAIAAGVGISTIADRSRRAKRAVIAACAVSLVLGPVFYAFAPSLSRRLGHNVVRHGKPYRDELRYWLVPWKADENSAERFATDALDFAEQRIAAGQSGVVIICDSTSEYPLLVTQRLTHRVKGIRILTGIGKWLADYDKDPTIFHARLAGKELYVVSPNLAGISDKMRKNFNFKPIGKVLFKVEPL